MSELELLQKKLKRALSARKMAEHILEQKAIELFNSNQLLKEANAKLTGEVAIKSNQLQEKEQRYKKFIDGATDSIYNFTEELQFLYVNNRTVELLEYSEEELLAMTVAELVHPNYLEMATSFFTDILEKQKKSAYIEFPVVSKSKRLIWAGTNITYVDDTSGVYYSAISRDISERKSIESDLSSARVHLERSEHKYRGILKNLQLGLIELDTDRRITYSNLIFQKMIGYSEDELLGAVPAELFLHKDDYPIESSIVSSDSSVSTNVYDVRLILKDQSIIHVLISKSPIYNIRNDVIGSIAIHYDITERKRLETELVRAKEIAENAQKEQQKFLAVMTHEIRTPLNSIVGMSHLLSDTKVTEEQEEYIGLINNASDMLQSLVSDILDLSKIQSGKQELVEEDFDLVKHLRNCISSIKIRSSDPDVVLLFEHTDYDKLWMRSDKKMIHQIVTNLLHNAVKFTKKGSITLKIKRLDRPNMIQIAVADTGIGIASDKLKIIFKEYEQANDYIHGIYGGTGLGLSICQKLATKLNSRLEVYSKLGKGTTFFMNLPIQMILDRNKIEKKIKPDDQDLSHLSILVAEDNSMNQKYISRLLEKKNIKFHIADNGAIAYSLALHHKFDLIFMDIHMPQMNGYEASMAIKKEGLNINTPIIALSASTLIAQKEEAISSGMQDFLSKPFNPNQLYAVIEKYNPAALKLSTDDEKISISEKDYQDLDRDTIRQFFGDDREYKMDMFQLFVDQIPTDLHDLEEAYRAGNLQLISQVCHKIKPSFQMVGLLKIAELVRKIEHEAGLEDTSVLHDDHKIFDILNGGIDVIKDEIITLHNID